MEEEIWSRLPFELVMVVLACLPYRSLARFKSVCKLWNSLPSTASFQQLCQHLPLHQDSYILFSGGDVLTLYAPTTRRWHRIGLKLPFPEDNFLFRVSAADGGLFCITEDGDDDVSCSVYNPLLNSSRQLPQLPARPDDSTHFYVERVNMIVDRFSNTYKVLAISIDDEGGLWRTHIYDSTCECWTETGNLSSVTDVPYYCRGSVICGPTLFALFDGRDYILMACDIGSRVWTKVTVRMPDFGKGGLCRLVESEGGLLLVGPLRHQIQLSPSLCVWEFNVSTTGAEWLEIARTDEIAGITRLVDMDAFQVVSHDNLLFIWSRLQEAVVIYDMKQHTWTSTGFPLDLQVRALRDPRFNCLVGGLSFGAKV